MAQHDQATIMTERRPLDGIRVLDLSWVRAGPWGTRILGNLGAEIIKAEWPSPANTYYTDRFARTGLPEGVEPAMNNNFTFSDKNANKKSVTLNVQTPRGMATLKALLGVSDVIFENFSANVPARWGLGYKEMTKIKPDIIYVSMSGLGHIGRDSSYTTFGPSAQALSGLTYLSGLPGAPPAGWGWSYMDDTAGMFGAMMIVAAVHHRNATGQGQHVDLAQVAVGVTQTGPAMLDFTVNGRPQRREGFPPGNRAHWPGTPLVNNYRGPNVAPHNSYRTAPGGYNDWCTIVCNNDEEWGALVRAMGSPAWAQDPRYATVLGRLRHQEEMDLHIEQWTKDFGKYEVMRLCQAAGVRAMPVQSTEDRVENDPQTQDREFYPVLDHAVMGIALYQNMPWRFSETVATTRSPGPLAGEHNREILCGILGLSEAELKAGYADSTYWPKQVPPEPYLTELVEVRGRP